MKPRTLIERETEIEMLVKFFSSLVQPGINYVKLHGGYVTQYQNKIQLLERENKKLKEKKERIQGRVIRAVDSGNDTEPEVISWLKDVEQMEEDIKEFLKRVDKEQHRHPKLIWHYRWGKEADKMKRSIIDLIVKAGELEKLPMACDAPFQWGLLFDSSQYYTRFCSRASIFDGIMEAFKGPMLNIIGLHGPGGSGKTTMAKEVAKEAKKLGIFDVIALAVVSKDPNIIEIQDDLATQLNLTYEKGGKVGRADQLRKRLNGKKKILVILDDVWSELDLNASGIPTSGVGEKGCKVLLTSRREEVFDKMNVQRKFSIGFLEEPEAWELFQKVAGDFVVDPSVAEKVCRKCGGLPIAIVAVGAALKGEDEFEWLNAMHELENSPLKYLEGISRVSYAPLKWSYDFLEDNAKSCFLLCSLFPEAAEISIDYLARYVLALRLFKNVDKMSRARIKVQDSVNLLKSSSLLLNGRGENFVKMHYFIRDLAISIAGEKQIDDRKGGLKWPEQQQFLVDDDIQEWPDNIAWEHKTAISLRISGDIPYTLGVLQCPEVHTVVLESRNFRFKILDGFFERMRKVTVSDLSGIRMESLPPSLVKLDNLRMLHLNNCLLGDLAAIRNLKKRIEILGLRGSSIKELPKEMGELTRLQLLDLRGCRQLKVIPEGVISNLIRLEELYVAERFQAWDTTAAESGMSNASIAELKLLNELTVLHIHIPKQSVRMLLECPWLFGKLTRWKISMNSFLHGKDYSPTNTLKLKNVPSMDEFNILLDKAERLELIDISGSENGLYDLGFEDLNYLSVTKCRDFQHLLGKPKRHTPSRGSFKKLTILQVEGCGSLKHLFPASCARALEQLQKLGVYQCKNMEQIIGVEGEADEEDQPTDETINLSRLQFIELCSLPKLRGFCVKLEKTTMEGVDSTATKSIFNEKVSIPALETLVIKRLPMIHIWINEVVHPSREPEKVSFCQLKDITVVECQNLVNVIPSTILPRLQNLEFLVVRHCDSLTTLGEGLNLTMEHTTITLESAVLPKLRRLELSHLPNLLKASSVGDDEYGEDEFKSKDYSSMKVLKLSKYSLNRRVYHLVGEG